MYRSQGRDRDLGVAEAYNSGRLQANKQQTRRMPKASTVALAITDRGNAPFPTDVGRVEVTGLEHLRPKRNPEISVQPKLGTESDSGFTAFISKGEISPYDAGDTVENSDGTDVNILRDTGASQTLLLEGTVKTASNTYIGNDVSVTGISGTATTLPWHRVRLDSGLVTGNVIASLAAASPVTGVKLLLGNDLAGDQVVTDPDPVMTESPIDSNHDTALGR